MTDPDHPHRLDPARGIINGLIAGALLWALIGVAIWRVI